MSDNTIDANPTKEFFIHMLTKDIGLVRAIVDLVDNSWDGALRAAQGEMFSDLSIEVNTSADQFSITDNCGGIPFQIAKDYAFRFGRPVDMQRTDHSVGQFGVGMKRSLFKMGKFFQITSCSKDCQFVIEIDVDKWVKKSKWEFEFLTVKKHTKKPRNVEYGTTVTAQ